MREHDTVIDLIAVANPSVYVSDPISVFQLNFVENLKVVELCVKYNKVRKVVSSVSSMRRADRRMEFRSVLPSTCCRHLFRAVANPQLGATPPKIPS